VFAEYLAKAIEGAEYEFIEDGTYFGTIPGFEGVWGNAKTIEACRSDLLGALEGWLILGIWSHDDDLPVLGELRLVPADMPQDSIPAGTNRQ
jgi:predicted RNase H-like HicB family nuclease